MKHFDLISSTYIDFNQENNKEDHKFRVGDHVRINVFYKRLHSKWSAKVFVIKKVKKTVPWTYVISHVNGKESVGTFYEKKKKKSNRV